MAIEIYGQVLHKGWAVAGAFVRDATWHVQEPFPSHFLEALVSLLRLLHQLLCSHNVIVHILLASVRMESWQSFASYISEIVPYLLRVRASHFIVTHAFQKHINNIHTCDSGMTHPFSDRVAFTAHG